MRLKTSGLLAFVAILIVVAPVLAAAYSAPYTIAETNSNAYTMLPVSVSVGNQWLADNGFMESDALDTRVETLGGLEHPHMVVDDRTLTAVSVSADSQTNLYFTTGNSDLSAMDIITGYGGYLTIADAAALELGDSFEIELKGYLDTSSGADKNLIYKEGAFITYVSAEGSITSSITGYSAAYPTVAAVTGGSKITDGTSHIVNLPTGIVPGNLLLVFFASNGSPTITFPNEGVDWVQLFEVSNSTYVKFGAWYRIADGTEDSTISVATSASERSAHTSYRITDYSGVPEIGSAAMGNSTNPNPPTLTPSWGLKYTLWFATVGYDDSWEEVNDYPLGYTDGRNDVAATGSGGVGVGTARRELTATSEDPGNYTLSGSDRWVANTVAIAPFFGEVVGVIATGVSSGEHTIKVTADTTDLKIYVDSIEKDSIALGGVSVLDTANVWIIADNSTTDFLPYMEYYKHTVSSTLIAHYEPNTMIIGTALPDREGAAQDAVITFGSNPAGVTVTLGGMVSEDQPVLGGIVADETIDILPAVGVSDWFGEPDVSGVLLANPLRPFVTLMSDTTTITELQAWRVLALAFILWVTVTAILLVRSHLLIAGIASGAAVGLAVAWTIFPLWALVFTIMAVIGGLVSERSPSL